MELYYIIAITDHDRGEAMGSLYHAAGLHLILSMPARGTATSEHLAIYGLDATEKCVIAAVGSAQEADSLIRSAKRKLFIDIPGNGVMLTVPLKSVAGGKTLSYLTDDLKAGGAPNMNFEHELITVILNEGYMECKLCGRPHAYLRDYGVCRVCFRTLAYKGEIPGVRKASW